MQTEIINMGQFHGGDWARTVQTALARGEGPCTLFFPPGRYDFDSVPAEPECCWIPNHDNDIVHRFAISLIGRRKIEIRGSGMTRTQFVFHGRVIPFRVFNCREVTLADFSIDFTTPFYGEGKVLDAGSDWFDMRLAPWSPAVLRDGELRFGDEPWWGAGEVEPESGRLASCLNLGVPWPPHFAVQERGDGVYRVSVPRPPRPGNHVILRHGKRDTPAIFLQRSESLHLERIAIHHAAGMGVVAEVCRDLTLDGIRVEPDAESGRHFSTCADATHFVHCMGNLTVENCTFRNQFDDAVNIHGIYAPVVRLLSPLCALAELRHPQHRGAEFADSGQRLRIIDRSTLLPLAELCAETVEVLQTGLLKLTFGSPLPEGTGHGAFENLDWVPETVRIHDNRMCDSNPRGILVSSGHEIVIERNRIDVPYCAVQIAGDASDWFESGAVADVTIRDNDLAGTNRLPGDAGRYGVITVNPELREQLPDRFYHGRVTVTGNCFHDFCGAPVVARGLGELIFSGNNLPDPGDQNQFGRLKAKSLQLS